MIEAEQPDDVRVAFRAAATEWRFVLPKGWWSVPLDDPARIDERVRTIVVERLGRRDDRARARRDARENLAAAAHEAAAHDGVSLTVFGMEIAGIALTGTMAVFAHGAAGDGEELLPHLAAAATGADVDQQRLPDGWVLRAVRASAIERTGADGNPLLPELRADYWTEREGLGQVLQISFTTPFVPLRAAMVELFDAVVLSLHPVVTA
ncbi:MAG: hypothetical protein FWF90_03470 [Promicromonosporaceae bacterium]|nr:hypothetical protein [Promicromonosporaceae bacterium]